MFDGAAVAVAAVVAAAARSCVSAHPVLALISVWYLTTPVKLKLAFNLVYKHSPLFGDERT